MNALIAWLSGAPQGAIAILAAALAAIVAVLVAVFTQWFLGRRARTELLTQKLEELYLALNEVSAHSVNRVEEAIPLITATPMNKPNITGSAVTRHGLDLHKKIVMLVRLYFPKLSAAHQAMFRCNSEVNMLISEAEVGPPLLEDRLVMLSVAYRDATVAMEEELIRNRTLLVRDHLLPVRYKRIAIRPSQPPPMWSDAQPFAPLDMSAASRLSSG